MPKNFENISDRRMIMLPEILMAVNKVKSRQEFFDIVGIARQNFNNVVTGHQHFTANHIQITCNAFGINANWIFGIQKNIFLKPKDEEKILNLNRLFKSQEIIDTLNRRLSKTGTVD